MTDSPDMLTTQQAAKLLGVNRATVARWVRLGQLPAIRLPSGHYRIRLRDIEEVLLSEEQGVGRD